jgi:repressor LexA
MFNMNRIKEILEEKGVKQIWLAEKLNKSYNMVNSYVQNRRQPSVEDLYRIADILGVEPGILLKNITPDVAEELTVKVPLLGMISCGSPLFADENIEAQIPVSVRIAKSGYRYFLLRASGDSMDEKGINDGDLVLIRQQSHAENGQDVVALIDNEATIKEYHNYRDKIILEPRSSNNRHQPIILTGDFRVLGVVVTIITR